MYIYVNRLNQVRRMLHEHTGISLAQSKSSMVYNRLVRRLRARGLTRFDRYFELVADDPTEREACINALTTNLTSFFREAYHVEFLADYVKRRHSPRLRIRLGTCPAASTSSCAVTRSSTSNRGRSAKLSTASER